MNGNLVAVIVTYNRLDKLKQTIERSRHCSFYRTVVVNNCSSDGTAEWLDSLQDDNLVVIHSAVNGGGAGGFNLGFRYVTEQVPESDWLVCYDDDAFPVDDIAARFNALRIPPDVGSLAAAVYLPDGRISEMNRPSHNPFWHVREFIGAFLKGRHGFHVSNQDYLVDEPMDIDASSFVGCFIRLDNIRKGHIGLPRSELFIYADDIIYVLEARRAGFRHWFVPTIVFQHDCQTLVGQQDVYHPLWKVYYTFRNRLEMYRIASGLLYPVILLIKIPTMFISVRFYEPRERRTFLSIAARAIWDGLRRDYRKSHAEVVALSQTDS